MHSKFYNLLREMKYVDKLLHYKTEYGACHKKKNKSLTREWIATTESRVSNLHSLELESGRGHTQLWVRAGSGQDLDGRNLTCEYGVYSAVLFSPSGFVIKGVLSWFSGSTSSSGGCTYQPFHCTLKFRNIFGTEKWSNCGGIICRPPCLKSLA